MYGCRVVVSDAVGARALVLGREWLGVTFRSRDWEHLRERVLAEIARGPLSEADRAAIADWAQCISPSAVASHFAAVVDHYRCGTALPLAAPYA